MAVDKLVDSTQLDADLTSVANAIRIKGGTSGSLAFPSGFVDAVEAIETGGGAAEEAPLNDVNFFDYDGACVYSYTKSEFLQLNSLPEGPSHAGLLFHEWNWSITDAKEYVAKYGLLEIGATYKTSDGSTRLYLDIFGASVLTAYIRCQPSVSGGVEIDWGDGTRQTVSGTSTQNISHTYTAPGEYIAKVFAVTGTVTFGGGSALNILGSFGNSTRSRLQTLRKIEFGNNVLFGTHVFNNLPNLESVVFPYNLTQINNYTFENTWGLPCLVFPSGFTSWSSTGNWLMVEKALSLPKSLTNATISVSSQSAKAFSMPDGCIIQSPSSNFSIQKIIIPDGVTSIAGNAFREARNTRYIEIGKDVASIGATSFMDAPASEIHLKPTTPPTLSNTNAFANWLQTAAIFYVPYSEDHSVLDAYKTATNWSTWASKMQEEPQ